MSRDLIFNLIDGDNVQPFGNLKTLLEAIHLGDKYSTVWRLLKSGDGRAEFGPYIIYRSEVIRAPFAIKESF